MMMKKGIVTLTALILLSGLLALIEKKEREERFQNYIK